MAAIPKEIKLGRMTIKHHGDGRVSATGNTGSGEIHQLKIQLPGSDDLHTIDRKSEIPNGTILETSSPGCYWYFWSGNYYYVC